MLLKLKYTRSNDKFAHVTVLGDAVGILDLYHQLTHNYKNAGADGTRIGTVQIEDLNGMAVEPTTTQCVMHSTLLSKHIK